MASGIMDIAFDFIKRVFGNDTGQPNENGWKVWFEESGRSGKVVFQGEGHSFSMYWEFGGGDVVAIIDVPTEEKWEKQTGIPLIKRPEILNFIGSETVRQKLSTNGYFKLAEDSILIYS